MKLFETGTEQQIGYRYYITAPNKLDTAERVKSYDNYARDAINNMLEWIQVLQEYRQQLYERYQEIAQANSRLQLKIRRDTGGYRGTKRWYYVELLKLYDRADIRAEAVISERFEGKDRAKAFARFKELQKQYPTIEHIQDTAKQFWER